MTIFAAVLMAVAAYLIGTFPSAHLVAYWTGHDPEVEGSGNPGASNVLRIAGKRAGAIVFAIDALKGLLPVLVGLAFSGRPLAAVGWVAATIGHILPAYRGFRGGKGVATAAAGAVAMFPIIGIGLLAAFALIARMVKKASVASLGVAAGFAILVTATGRPGWEIAVTLGVVAIIVIRHAGNIARLVRRREHSITR